MCVYGDVLGSGPVLQVQALTVVAIAASIAFWVWAYRKLGVPLRLYALPIMLWMAFGTLDILITARGTFDNPFREGNPLARLVFAQSGFAGPVVASVLWIALWSSVVLLVNKKAGWVWKASPMRDAAVAFVSLSVFYSVAVGHFFGFSSWFLPLCPLAQGFALMRNVAGIAAIGCALSAAHLGAKRFWDKIL
jgi:hypothetical protein